MTGPGDPDDRQSGDAGHGGAARLAALCALPLAAIIALRRTFDVDLPWHLATGRLILERRSSLPADPFSFSAAGAPWPYKDLVADVILYGGFARLGYPWLALLKGAAVLGIALGLWLAPPPGRRRLLPWLAGLLAYLLAVQYRVTERPILFSLAAFPLLLALCERARRLLCEGGAPVRALAPPVLLLWAWAQLHREALVGLVTLGGLPLALLLGRLLAGTRLAPLCHGAPPRAALTAALAAAAAGALLLLNPSGAAFYRTTLALSRSAVLQEAPRRRSSPITSVSRRRGIGRCSASGGCTPIIRGPGRRCDAWGGRRSSGRPGGWGGGYSMSLTT